MMNPLPIVRANLRRHGGSSLGILLLLSLAFSATVAVSIFDRGLQRAGAATSRDTDLVIGAAGSSLQLVLATVFLQASDVLPLIPAEVLDRLAADPGVAAVSPLIFADHYRGSPIVGIGADFPRLKPGLRLAGGRWPTTDFEVVVGSAVDARISDSFESSHGVVEAPGAFEEAHHEARYTVVGLLAQTRTPWDRGIYTPYTSLWAIHGIEDQHGTNAQAAAGTRGVSALLVKPRDFASAYALRAKYGTGALTAVFPGEVLARVFAVFDDVKAAFTVLSVLFQLIVFAAVLLSLLASLPARTKWIGLLRALGASRAYIFVTVWAQSAVVFFLAGVVGAIVGWAGAGLLSGLVAGRTGLHLPVSITSAELTVLGIFWLAGLVGSLIPAGRGFRMTIRRAFLDSGQ
jgi:putative ABC transport system permease protein